MTSKIVTFGESLLRLTPPGFERFLQTPHLNATFGGAEANVAVALASFGLDAAHVTVLPENNPIADAAIAELRRFGVDTSRIVRGKGRFGIYYLEAGADRRPARVHYDRDHSAMALAKPGDIRWERALEGAEWFHITGITPAISASAADLAIESMKKARAMNITVSFDLNYRQHLWTWGRSAREVMNEMMTSADVLIGNEEHIRMVLGLTGAADMRDVAEHTLAAHNNLKAVAVSARTSATAHEQSCSACLNDRTDFLMSRQYDISRTVDRIGAGDAFAAGLIYGWTQLPTRQDALDFAAAASCLKHSIPGDFCRATVEEVQALVRNEGGGRVKR